MSQQENQNNLLIEQANKYFSSVRMYRFHELENISPVAAYLENIDISQNIFSLISILEVILRNRIDFLMSEKFGENYLTESNLSLFNEYEIKLIEKAIRKVNKSNLTIKNSRIVTELTFGFWCRILSDNNFLWCKCLYKMFSKDIRQKYPLSEIKRRIDGIARLRNKIAHHQRIINKDDPIILQSPIWIYEMILWLIDENDKQFKTELEKHIQVILNDITTRINKYNPK